MIEPYTNSGHGHAWKRPDGHVENCYGPGECQICNADIFMLCTSNAIGRTITLESILYENHIEIEKLLYVATASHSLIRTMLQSNNLTNSQRMACLTIMKLTEKAINE